MSILNVIVIILAIGTCKIFINSSKNLITLFLLFLS